MGGLAAKISQSVAIFALSKSEQNLKRQLQKIQKKMEVFDQNIEADTITTKNFIREDYMW